METKCPASRIWSFSIKYIGLLKRQTQNIEATFIYGMDLHCCRGESHQKEVQKIQQQQHEQCTFFSSVLFVKKARCGQKKPLRLKISFWDCCCFSLDVRTDCVNVRKQEKTGIRTQTYRIRYHLVGRLLPNICTLNTPLDCAHSSGHALVSSGAGSRFFIIRQKKVMYFCSTLNRWN